jgi:hypothetical protein
LIWVTSPRWRVAGAREGHVEHEEEGLRIEQKERCEKSREQDRIA